MRFSNKPVGWRNDSYRHYLAAKGVSTVPKKYMAELPKKTVTKYQIWGRGDKFVEDYDDFDSALKAVRPKPHILTDEYVEKVEEDSDGRVTEDGQVNFDLRELRMDELRDMLDNENSGKYSNQELDEAAAELETLRGDEDVDEKEGVSYYAFKESLPEEMPEQMPEEPMQMNDLGEIEEPHRKPKYSVWPDDNPLAHDDGEFKLRGTAGVLPTLFNEGGRSIVGVFDFGTEEMIDDNKMMRQFSDKKYVGPEQKEYSGDYDNYEEL